MKHSRVATGEPRRWRGGREIGGRRVWRPVTDTWVGTSDSRLWCCYVDNGSGDTETWLDQLRVR
jgi:hypothetical protein